MTETTTNGPDTSEAQSQDQAPQQQDKQQAANGAANGSTEGKIQELEAQVKEKEAKYLYLYAEFENFKKRAIKERSDLIKFGWEGVARDLLQVIDNLERAIAHTPPGTDKNLMVGLKMVHEQFRSSLEKQGVRELKAVGQSFDPNLHEGVGQEASDQPSGTIIKEHEKGYMLHDRLLRPARVIIGSGNK